MRGELENRATACSMTVKETAQRSWVITRSGLSSSS